MKKLLVVTALMLISISLKAQELTTDSLGFQTFTYERENVEHLMKQYFLVFLKKGEKQDHSPEEAAEIQKAHLDHLSWLAEEDYLDIAGPMGDDGEIRGILIMRVPTKEKALELASKDPAVKAGRLSVEVHPWWAAVGSTLK